MSPSSPISNKKSVFISRELSDKSVFRDQLQETGIEVIGVSLLRFEAVPFTSYPTTDWIFFYSRKAVHFFINQIDRLPHLIKIAAYGSGTAAALSKENVTVDFIGSGSGKDTSLSFLAIAKNKSVLFPQARHSRRTIEHLAGNQIDAFPLVVYDNRKREDILEQQAGILVFTSPLNVMAYFENYTLNEQQRVVVIGSATAGAVRAFGIEELVIAKEASEEGLAAAVLQMIE